MIAELRDQSLTMQSQYAALLSESSCKQSLNRALQDELMCLRSNAMPMSVSYASQGDNRHYLESCNILPLHCNFPLRRTKAQQMKHELQLIDHHVNHVSQALPGQACTAKWLLRYHKLQPGWDDSCSITP